jgi:hypothetical protein
VKNQEFTMKNVKERKMIYCSLTMLVLKLLSPSDQNFINFFSSISEKHIIPKALKLDKDGMVAIKDLKTIVFYLSEITGCFLPVSK